MKIEIGHEFIETIATIGSTSAFGAGRSKFVEISGLSELVELFLIQFGRSTGEFGDMRAGTIPSMLFEEFVGTCVATGDHALEKIVGPSVQNRRSNKADVDAHSTVCSRAIEANHDTERHRAPLRVFHGAIKTDFVCQLSAYFAKHSLGDWSLLALSF
jgi:hypothetical protein